MREIFFEAFFSLVQLCWGAKEEFLKEKLVKKTKEFFVVFESFGYKDNHVVQYSRKDFLRWLEDFSGWIEIFTHLKLISLSPALLAQKNLLRLRLAVFSWVPLKNMIKAGEPIMTPSTDSVLKADNKRNEDAKRAVLDYLKNNPGSQIKDLALHCKDRLSRRTIQRHLHRLISEGTILRNKENGPAKYFLSGSGEVLNELGG